MILTFVTLAFLAHADQKPYPEPGRGSARYEVPTEDEALKDSAMYEIRDIRTRERDGVVQIRYSLPLELTGVKNEVRLESTGPSADGTFTRFKGEKGAANCDALTCNVHYKNVKVDLPLVEKILVSQGLTGLDLKNRLKISEQFGGDPAGIIHFDQSKLQSK